MPLAPFVPKPAVLRRARRVLRPLQRYHRHRVTGLENIPATGPVLLVVHHSLATYDAFMFGLALVEATGRTIRGLGDDMIFKTPGVSDMMRAIGVVPASPAHHRPTNAAATGPLSYGREPDELHRRL